MEMQLTLSSSSAKIEIKQYKSYGSSVGNNLKSIQITTKYRYQMLKQNKLKTFCQVSIEEACKRWKIEIVILKVLNEHAHMIVDCLRTISDSKLMQIIKWLSSYILFRLCPNFRKRYPEESFGMMDIFVLGVANNFARETVKFNDKQDCEFSDFERALRYIENQELHHNLS